MPVQRMSTPTSDAQSHRAALQLDVLLHQLSQQRGLDSVGRRNRRVAILVNPVHSNVGPMITQPLYSISVVVQGSVVKRRTVQLVLDVDINTRLEQLGRRLVVAVVDRSVQGRLAADGAGAQRDAVPDEEVDHLVLVVLGHQRGGALLVVVLGCHDGDEGDLAVVATDLVEDGSEEVEVVGCEVADAVVDDVLAFVVCCRADDLTDAAVSLAGELVACLQESGGVLVLGVLEQRPDGVSGNGHGDAHVGGYDA